MNMYPPRGIFKDRSQFCGYIHEFQFTYRVYYTDSDHFPCIIHTVESDNFPHGIQGKCQLSMLYIAESEGRNYGLITSMYHTWKVITFRIVYNDGK